jgi:hypothetical protein
LAVLLEGVLALPEVLAPPEALLPLEDLGVAEGDLPVDEDDLPVEALDLPRAANSSLLSIPSLFLSSRSNSALAEDDFEPLAPLEALLPEDFELLAPADALPEAFELSLCDVDGLADDAEFFFASSAACAAKARAEKLVMRKAVVNFMDGTLLWVA